MAITKIDYHNFLLGQMSGVANGVVDFDTDAIKVALATNSYVPNAATHDFFDDVTNEVTGGNYTAGGATLASKTVSLNAGVVTFDAADVTFAASGTGFTNARYAIVYRSTGVASTSRLIVAYNLGGDVGNSVADFVLVWNASGIVSWSFAA